jgi:hypothetical protein
MSTQTFGLSVIADGEVRDGDTGEVISTARIDAPLLTDDGAQMEVTYDDLYRAVRRNGSTDDQLRQLGIPEDTIQQIRQQIRSETP